MRKKSNKSPGPPAVSLQRVVSRPTGDELAQLLVRHGIVDPCAVEDADGFDHGRTLDAIFAAAAQLRESANDRPKLRHENQPRKDADEA